MGGLVGRLFREFAVTIGTAVLVSGAISLTLTPLLCSRFLRDPAEGRHGRIYAFNESLFQAMQGFYAGSLKWALAHRRLVMVFSLIVLLGTGFLFKVIPKGFLPSEDQNRIMVQTEAPEGVSFDSMVTHQQALATIIQQDENMQAFMSSVGGNNTGRMLILLKPRNARRLSADDVIQELRPKLAAVPGIRAYLQNPPPIQIGGRMSKNQYQYTLQGPDIDALYMHALKLQEQIRDLPGFQDVTSDMLLKNPELNVIINRDLASSRGVTAAQIEGALLDAYGSRQVSTIFAADDQYQVILELLPEYQANPEVLSLLYVRSASGQLVPIQALATQQEDVGPLQINHSGQLPSVTISFNLKPGVSIGEAVAKINDLARREIPASISFQGTAQAFQSSFAGMGFLLVLAILVIYVVLGILYENFYHPVTILSALPFAGIGALLTLLLFNTELSLYAFVGIIMLVGLVKKNGIMMIDFAIEAKRSGGKSSDEAIYEACLIRFRPIMMTTMAALMAGLPIALGLGAGAESRRPLGLAVVGGLLFSQTLTLYVTPVFYLYMEKLQNLVRQRRGLPPL